MKTIQLAEEISNNIAIRSTLRTVLDTLGTNVTIDFANVEFMSRSCTDEYIKWRADKKVIEKNMSAAVRTMIEIVSNKTPRTASATNFGAVEVI